MSPAPTQRPKWEIDRLLDGLIDEDVRVAARSFSPTLRKHEASFRFIPVRDLFLPDNSQPSGLPVFFEGRLRQFDRQIGAVFVWLGSPASPDGADEGTVYYRRKTAVILRGPAVVELAWPFQVEKLPADPGNYWRDLRVPRAQFEFPFAMVGEDGRRDAKSPTGLLPALTIPAAIQLPQAREQRLAPVDLPPPSAVDRVGGEDALREERCRLEPGQNQALIRNLNCSPSTH